MKRNNKRLLKRTSNPAFLIICLIFISTTLYAGGAQEKTYPADKADEYIKAHVAVNHFSGSVLISRGSEVIISEGYGFADYENAVPNTPRTKFRLLSLTKQFTAAAIMMLEERGLLNVDDKLSDYISGYPQGDMIKLKHLLTHTSGIPDHTELPGYRKERRVFDYSVTRTIESFREIPLEFTPGERFKYSNSGYILLGYIIEQVTDMTYEDFVIQNIFIPLKMDNSGFEKPDVLLEHRARGYKVEADEIINAAYRNMANAHASGALYSTVEDMYLWDRALYTEKLVSKSSLERMFAPVNGVYGYGWGVARLFNHRMLGHNGESDGFRSNISRFVDDEVCIIVLSNMENTNIGRMSVDLAAILFGEKYELPRIKTVVQVDKDLLQEYVGSYELKPDIYFEIGREDSRLFCQLTGQDKLELFAEAEAVFFLKEVDASISFIRGEDSEIEKLILQQGGQEVSALKIYSH